MTLISQLVQLDMLHIFQSNITYLEAGCGVGNMLFPLAAAFPNFRLQGFDFSKNAVDMLRQRADELQVSLSEMHDFFGRVLLNVL